MRQVKGEGLPGGPNARKNEPTAELLSSFPSHSSYARLVKPLGGGSEASVVRRGIASEGVPESMDVEWESISSEYMPASDESLFVVDFAVKLLATYLCDQCGEAPELVCDMVAMESAYQRGRLEEARSLAEKVISRTSNPCALLLAYANHMVSAVAMGDADGAYGDVGELYRRCLEGLGNPEDSVLHGISLLRSEEHTSELQSRI